MSPVALPDDWVDGFRSALQSRPLPEGSSFSVVVNVTGTAAGDQSAAFSVDEGWLQSVDAPEEPDLVVLAAAKDAASIVDSSIPLAVGFMRGKVKISGDPVSALAVLRASTKESD